MEQYYYNHMDKQKQAAYHGILQGITSLVDEFQIPALDINTATIKIHRTSFLFRNICLIKEK